MRSDLPTGTVTLLFTDIEGSTRLLGELGEGYAALLADHRRLLREAFAANGGVEVDNQGDSFFVAFSRPQGALGAAAEAQRVLAEHSWSGATVRVRMGIHTGSPATTSEGYVGMDVHCAARVMASAHGGQVVISQSTREIVSELLPDGLSLRDLGEHRLKDLTLPQRLYQLCGNGLEVDFPPLKSLERPTNLPAQPTDLIGRERELGELLELLLQTRLLTLTGTGGCGKTRVALQLGAELVERFSSGVFFVALSSIRDPALVPSTIAQSLGLREQPGQTLEETLAEHLRDRELLLVLDNFEQVVEAAPAVASLLAGAPLLRIVVTSREPLHLAGEYQYEVPPLTARHASELFVERARAVKGRLAVDDVAVVEICRRLDHLPLAIELAAARAKMLPLRALLQRLDERLELLTGGPRDRDERQRTLEGAIAWSYDLLPDDERALLRGVAVFAGGWTLEAAEAVAAPRCEVDVLDVLGSLVDKSLVREEGLDGEPRFSLLETIREYAGKRLEERGELALRRRLHAEHYMALVLRASDERLGPGARGWLELLERELDNLRAALAWSLENGEIELGLGSLANGLDRFWAARGRIREGRSWIEQLLERAHGVAARVRAEGALTGARLALWQGDYDRTAELATEAAELFRSEGDAKNLSLAMGMAGWAHSRTDPNRAATLFEEALALARGTGDALATTSALNNLATLLSEREEHERSLQLREECLAIARASGDRLSVATVLGNLGASAFAAGDEDRAREALKESLALARELGDARQATWAAGWLGIVSLFAGERVRAEELLTTSIREAFAGGYTRDLPWCLLAVAAAAAAAGERERAARLAGAAEGLQQEMGYSPDHVDARVLELCRSGTGLDERAWDRLRTEGQALPLEEAVALALSPRSGVAAGARSRDDAELSEADTE